ncbi:hypothetical protein L228DRAFT_213466 [Xylona heveae TC161]|uniref:Zn(2)-C6 fungal-type domain-containing protein n=1 Tax=Xylona heveae (strain CBS 132557 / TC161) TaxID=1328760 RepID=A0A165AA25_XYLHT|nr:hypothetical protein L228DRAFT_213466 [Xylona heveae TC161]KZF20154.1 hypothetical protein L228DRAFT_213466 [Xylona heveae TC161]
MPSQEARRRTSTSGSRPRGIWTGAQFLPRFIAEHDVPGEGPCYFYDDGTHCKTVIDGEVVNAQWGVTKAGKPRKRLAVACLTCREKKIKCEPDFPKCVQCEKFGRECRFQNANFLAEKKKKMEGQLSPELSWGMLKGLGSDKMLPQRKGSSEGHFVYATKSPPRDLALTRTHSVFQLHVDPYQSDPELTGQLMEVYFLHINHQCLSLFPSTPFLLWAKTAKDKSDRDLMLLYTIMAVAAHLSPRQEHKSYAETFAGLSRCALERHWNKPSVQLCQSRLLMALYCFAEGQKAEAWEYAGSSLRTASALGLHSEYVPLGEMKVDDSLGYAHTSAAIKEVRRRTFWAVYLADRILSFDTCSPAILNDEDVFLRLPCRDDLFEDGVESSAPFFDNKIINSELCRSVNERNINPMGFLVQIASIYMEVARDVYRTVHCSVNSYKNNYESFYARAEQRLAEWRNSLPSPFIESSENLGRSIQDGRIGIYLGIHAVHFATVMKLNRYARGACLSSQSIRRNIFQAWQCSQRWLQIVRDLNQTKHMLPGRNASVIPPFVSFTTLTACDILSARGRVVDWRTILNGMNEGVALVGDVGVFWASPRMQAKAILGRIAELSRAVLNQSSDQADQVIFAMQFPLESKDNCPQDLDLVYSTPTAWYSDILPSP